MKKNVAIVMGGYSKEYEISINSGNVVYDNISKEKFNTFKVIVNEDEWFAKIDSEKYYVDKNDFSITIKGEKIKFDAVYNIIHGSPGEDGMFSAYLEMLNIPHNTCNHFEAALTFSKRECISVVKSYGINVAKSVFLNIYDELDENNIIKKVGLPCMVKPNRAGSSIGISKVEKKEDLTKAISKAFDVDTQIMVEEFIQGTEVSVGIVYANEKLQVLPITEIVTDNSFFDYNAKYKGESKEITPARISNKDKKTVESTAINIYKLLNIKGFSRAEYIIRNGIPYFIEINTIPGFSKESILPQQINKTGISINSILDDAITYMLKK